MEEIKKVNRTLDETVASLNRSIVKLDLDKFVFTQISTRDEYFLLFRATLQTNLLAEKEGQETLQKALGSERARVSTLQFDVHDLNIIKQVKKKT